MRRFFVRSEVGYVIYSPAKQAYISVPNKRTHPVTLYIPQEEEAYHRRGSATPFPGTRRTLRFRHLVSPLREKGTFSRALPRCEAQMWLLSACVWKCIQMRRSRASKRPDSSAVVVMTPASSIYLTVSRSLTSACPH